jgi:hypothetical protein
VTVVTLTSTTTRNNEAVTCAVCMLNQIQKRWRGSVHRTGAICEA